MPKVSAITNISLEHTGILGTHWRRSPEKKPELSRKASSVVGRQELVALEVIEETAAGDLPLQQCSGR